VPKDLRPDPGPDPDPAAPRPPAGPGHVVVVGPCASGKSTLVRGLRERGYDAVACGQEHSEIPTLWRHTDPDVVIALEVDLATVRRRRGEDWPRDLFETQRRRLTDAVAHARLVVDTSSLDGEELVERVAAVLAAPESAPAIVGTPTAH
jgi:hypothetical protein